MYIGQFTPKEEEIIKDLLMKKGISIYRFMDEVGEGRELPGSTYPWEVESISGCVITPTKLYYFWLDWIDGHYSLGEEDGTWEELTLEEFARDKTWILQVQQKLKEEEANL